MKFLHLSDLHIGKRLNGLQLLDDQKYVLAQAVQLARVCDAVLLAGDLYDKVQPSAEAVKIISDFLVALSELQKPVFVISGNHDSAEQITYCRSLLGRCGVFVAPVFDGKLSSYVLCDEHGELTVWLLPFIKPASVRSFFPDVHGYEDAVRLALGSVKLNTHQRNILVAHQFVSGAKVCESESRLIGGLDQIGTETFAGFDYVALGHLHSPQRLDHGRVRYCGSPLKYSLSEVKQRKVALIVTLGTKGDLSVEQHAFEPLHDLRTLRGNLRELCISEGFSEDYIYAILTDENALIDPLGTLRLTYPNLIGMRVQNSRTNEEMAFLELEDAESLTPLEHFAAFYEVQNNHQSPDKQRMNLMRAIIEEAEERQHAAN